MLTEPGIRTGRAETHPRLGKNLMSRSTGIHVRSEEALPLLRVLLRDLQGAGPVQFLSTASIFEHAQVILVETNLTEKQQELKDSCPRIRSDAANTTDTKTLQASSWTARRVFALSIRRW
jgi:hypothetical protein